jgi:hypothetical protein
MSVLEYERRFHDLSLFALRYVPTEEHMIKKLRDGLWLALKSAFSLRLYIIILHLKYH